MTTYAIREDAGRYQLVRWLDGRGHDVERLADFACTRGGIRAAVAHLARYVSPSAGMDATPAPTTALGGLGGALGGAGDALPTPACGACGSPLPPSRTRPRRYCSDACRGRHHRRTAA